MGGLGPALFPHIGGAGPTSQLGDGQIAVWHRHRSRSKFGHHTLVIQQFDHVRRIHFRDEIPAVRRSGGGHGLQLPLQDIILAVQLAGNAYRPLRIALALGHALDGPGPTDAFLLPGFQLRLLCAGGHIDAAVLALDTFGAGGALTLPACRVILGLGCLGVWFLGFFSHPGKRSGYRRRYLFFDQGFQFVDTDFAHAFAPLLILIVIQLNIQLVVLFVLGADPKERHLLFHGLSGQRIIVGRLTAQSPQLGHEPVPFFQ